MRSKKSCSSLERGNLLVPRQMDEEEGDWTELAIRLVWELAGSSAQVSSTGRELIKEKKNCFEAFTQRFQIFVSLLEWYFFHPHLLGGSFVGFLSTCF